MVSLVFHLEEIQQEFLLSSWCPDSDWPFRAQIFKERSCFHEFKMCNDFHLRIERDIMEEMGYLNIQ